MHSFRVCGCWHPDCIPRGSATFAVLQSLNQATDANFDVECELGKSDAVAKKNTLLHSVNGLYINEHYIRQSVNGRSPSRYMPPATATFFQTKPLRMSSVIRVNIVAMDLSLTGSGSADDLNSSSALIADPMTTSQDARSRFPYGAKASE